jgi:hypothetical protein
MLAYAFWQRSFGGDPSVVGRRMTLSGERYEIIGVLEPLQNGPVVERSTLSGDRNHEPPDVYLPFQIDPKSSDHGHFFNVAGRVKAGISMAAADAQLQASYPEYARKWPGEDAPGRKFCIQALREGHWGQHSVFARSIFALVAFGRGRFRAADRLRQCRQSSASAGYGAEKGNRDSHSRGRRPW